MGCNPRLPIPVVALFLPLLAGYDLPLAGSGPLGVHRLVEAMKHAFALRTNLGDPGPAWGGNSSVAGAAVDPLGSWDSDSMGYPFVNLTAVLRDMLSNAYTRELRWAP